MNQKIEIFAKIHEVLPSLPPVFTVVDVIHAIGISYHRKSEVTEHLWRMVEQGKLYEAEYPYPGTVDVGRKPWAWTADYSMSKVATSASSVLEAIKKLPTKFGVEDLITEMGLSIRHRNRIKRELLGFMRAGTLVRVTEVDIGRVGRRPMLFSADPQIIEEENAIQQNKDDAVQNKRVETLLDPHAEYDIDALVARTQMPDVQEPVVPFTEHTKRATDDTAPAIDGAQAVQEPHNTGSDSSPKQ
jgi:hypothetical protein